jgi:glycosyltransferase involved in cell wall biosynthesis
MKNVHEILGKSDLFLLPSEDESFGLAALEAMSCEFPVVASNIGGLKELITHGVDGYLIKVGDV